MSQPVLAMDQVDVVPQSPKRIAILEAASKLFVNQGFGNVSVDAIAAEAQVSKRTVYSHFENKEALFAGVMTAVCERRGGQAGCPLASEDLARYMPLGEMLQKTGEHVLGIITAPETVDLFRVVIGDAGRFPDLGHNFYAFGPASMHEMVRDYLEEKASSGELKIDDPMKAAKRYLGMMIFPVQMELACGVRDSLSGDEVRTIVESAVSDFLKLYTP